MPSVMRGVSDVLLPCCRSGLSSYEGINGLFYGGVIREDGDHGTDLGNFGGGGAGCIG